MGALAHYIENSGIATTQISLIREHTALISPPRALWVSFPLGRPFGIPNNTNFQHRVLGACLNLLTVEAGPVLVNFEEDIPELNQTETEGWTCPVSLAEPIKNDTALIGVLERELQSLTPWYSLSLKRRGRTTFGTSGLNPEKAMAFISAFFEYIPDNPSDELKLEELFKQCCEDLKAFYSEAATAQPGSVSPDAIQEWFWNETALGKALIFLHDKFLVGSDENFKALALHGLIPRRIQERRGGKAPQKPLWHTDQSEF